MGIAELVRSKAVAPVELSTAARDVNPLINAIVADVDPPVSAEAADAPFFGVPFLIKDLHQHLAGHPTSARTRVPRNGPAAESSTVVQ